MSKNFHLKMIGNKFFQNMFFFNFSSNQLSSVYPSKMRKNKTCGLFFGGVSSKIYHKSFFKDKKIGGSSITENHSKCCNHCMNDRQVFRIAVLDKQMSMNLKASVFVKRTWEKNFLFVKIYVRELKCYRLLSRKKLTIK